MTTVLSPSFWGVLQCWFTKSHRRESFEKGEVVDKTELNRLGILDFLYRLIKTLGLIMVEFEQSGR